MDKYTKIIKEIKILKRAIKNSHLYRKRIYTIKEASIVIGVSYSYMQKLITQRKIPYSKPTGKLIFIKRRDLEKFILRNPVITKEDEEMFIANNIINSKL